MTTTPRNFLGKDEVFKRRRKKNEQPTTHRSFDWTQHKSSKVNKLTGKTGDQSSGAVQAAMTQDTKSIE